ncbi:MAG: hypothetical protein IPJ04_15335 [Candidatus Eisenbacteria bacterium]|nr:hypothetical protein [Candidatus Eisenbacteria bacterium]
MALHEPLTDGVTQDGVEPESAQHTSHDARDERRREPSHREDDGDEGEREERARGVVTEALHAAEQGRPQLSGHDFENGHG